MRRVWFAAGLAAFLLATVSNGGFAQSNPVPASLPATATASPQPGAAPVITAMVPGYESLSVIWGLPAGVGEADVAGFDLRHIRSDAEDKSDENWTVVSPFLPILFTTALTGLSNGVSYDVQIRMDTGSVSAWSPSTKGTPAGPGSSFASATELPGSIGVAGRLDSADDADYFKFTVASLAEVHVWTDGPLKAGGGTAEATVDTRGVLYKDTGTGGFEVLIEPSGNRFSIARTLEPATYYVKIDSKVDDIGEYSILFLAYRETSGISNARPIILDSYRVGIIGPPSFDPDFYELVVSEPTNVHIYTASQLDLALELRDSTDRVMFANDHGLDYLNTNNSDYDADLVVNLTAGTYYIVVGHMRRYLNRPYSIHVNRKKEPGTSFASATFVEPGSTVTGAITTSNDADYFRFRTQSPTLLRVGLLSSETISPDLKLEFYDSKQNVFDEMQIVITHDDFKRSDSPHNLVSYQGFLTGTNDVRDYFIRVSTTGRTGPYAMRLTEDDAFARFHSTCAGKDTRPTAPEDLYYGCQWHLNNDYPATTGQDINVEPVWEAGITGNGANVLVIDHGFNSKHEDLIDNVMVSRNHDVRTGTGEILNPFNDHGTLVAGLIAADDNNIGVRGIAPDASIYGYNLRNYSNYATEIFNAVIHHKEVTAVANMSLRFRHYGKFRQLGAIYHTAIGTGTSDGFHGKGVAYVYAAGNGYSVDSANLGELVNHFGAITVCAVDWNDEIADYSSPGSNLWVCGPSGGNGNSGVVTTRNAQSYGPASGTSSSTPIVSGVIALLRSAYPHLTWRDVTLILAASARKVDPTDTSWLQGALQYSSSTKRYSFSDRYGFGMVDAKAAIDLAENWLPLPKMLSVDVADDFIDVTLPDDTTTFHTEELTVDTPVTFTEFAEVSLDFEHASARDLDIRLVSPSGAESVLLAPATEVEATFDGKFRFGTSRHLGEDPNGKWQLKVRDTKSGTTGTIRKWEITVYGHGTAPAVTGPLEIDYVETHTGPVATYTATNPNNAAQIAFDVSGRDEDHFTIDSSGVLRFKEQPDYETPKDRLGDSTYHLEVLARDGSAHVGVRHVLVNVVDAAEPEITPSDHRVQFAENGTGNVQVFTAVQPQTGTITWSLAGADADAFQIDRGTLTFKTTPDYEAPGDADADNTYELTVRTVGDGGTDETTFAVAVKDVDEPPRIAGPTDIDHPERTAGPGSYSATDPEGSKIVWQLFGADAGQFTINNGNLKFTTPPTHTSPKDADSDNRYQINVEASDHTGNTASLAVTVTVTQRARRERSVPPPRPTTLPVPTFPPGPRTAGGGPPPEGANEAPQFSPSAPLERSIAENTPAGATVGDPIIATDPEGDDVRYSLTGEDASHFDIDAGTGELTISADTTLDYETRTAYTLTVTATDRDGSGRTSEATLTIDVIDESLPDAVAAYDADNNEKIDPREIARAIQHYIARRLTEREIVAIVRHYLHS